MIDLSSKEYLFVQLYFAENNFSIIKQEQKAKFLQILAKDLKTGRNETFALKGSEMKMLFFNPTSKKKSWHWQTVARGQVHNRQSHLERMHEAVNSSEQ